MSMDLQLQHSETSNDLLDDGGALTLDTFALPPEPTVNLSQLHATARAYQQQRSEDRQLQVEGGEPVPGLATGTARPAPGVQCVVASAPVRPSAAKITCQVRLCNGRWESHGVAGH